MLYLVVKPLKIVYKFDTEIHSAVEDWCINILGLNYDHVYFYDKPIFKQRDWPEVFVEVKVKNGYTFTIKDIEVTKFTKAWIEKWQEKVNDLATLKEMYMFYRKRRPNRQVGKELRWLIKKHGEGYPVRRLL
jgi:hypothetical protein